MALKLNNNKLWPLILCLYAHETWTSDNITKPLSSHYLVTFFLLRTSRDPRFSFPKTWRIQGNKRAIFCPLCCQFLYLIYIPSSLLCSLSCPQNKKGKERGEQTKYGMRKFLEARNVSASTWQPLSWQHTLMRPTDLSATEFFFLHLSFPFLYCYDFSYDIREKHQRTATSSRAMVMNKMSLDRNVIRNSKPFQNLSHNIRGKCAYVSTVCLVLLRLRGLMPTVSLYLA